MLLKKELLFILLTCCCSLFTGSLSAQIPSYQPVLQKIEMNAQMTRMMMTPMNFGYLNTQVQKHHFMVIINDSTTLNVYGKIHSDSSMQYLQWTDKTVNRKDSGRYKKIYPYQTKALTRNDKNQPQYTGFSADSCWLFKAITGTITCYSPVADAELTAGFIRYIQKKNGPLLKMTPDHLEEMLKDNEQAMHLFKKKKYDKAIAAYNENE
jgi:hypothetical protein